MENGTQNPLRRLPSQPLSGATHLRGELQRSEAARRCSAALAACAHTCGRCRWRSPRRPCLVCTGVPRVRRLPGELRRRATRRPSARASKVPPPQGSEPSLALSPQACARSTRRSACASDARPAGVAHARRAARPEAPEARGVAALLGHGGLWAASRSCLCFPLSPQPATQGAGAAGRAWAWVRAWRAARCRWCLARLP